LFVYFPLVSKADCNTPVFTSFCEGTLALVPNHTSDQPLINYLHDIEEALSYIWPLVTNRVDTISERENFQVCNDCVNLLKHTICSSFVPSCGFLSCVQSSQSTINSTCPNQCATPCANQTSEGISICDLCTSNCIAGIIISSCGEFMVSNEMCSNLVSVCSCNNQHIDTICQYFPDNGYTIPYPSSGNTLSCTGVQGWCRTGDKRDDTDDSAGIFSVNDNIQFKVPLATGEDKITDPVITHYVVPTNTTGDSMSLVPLALLSFTAMFL